MLHAIALRWLAWVSLALASAGAAPALAQPAGTQQDPDWPCIQVLVPQIASAQIWTGPPVEPVAQAWRKDPAVRELAPELAARRTPLEMARERIAAFAAGLEPERKDEKLTALFAGVLETINRDRASLIAGIKRFTGKQRGLSAQIQQANARLREVETGTAEEQALLEERNWAIRIFDERESSLTYLCEQPVLLERRAFALAREIAAELE
jgi:hypothetical protein